MMNTTGIRCHQQSFYALMTKGFIRTTTSIITSRQQQQQHTYFLPRLPASILLRQTTVRVLPQHQHQQQQRSSSTMIFTKDRPHIIVNEDNYLRLRQPQQFRFRSMKVRRRKHLKRERELAAKKPEDIPKILDNYVYITTVDDANEWARNAMEDILVKHINAQRTLYVGMHIVWYTPDDTEYRTMMTKKKNISLPTAIRPPQKRIAVLQLSLIHTPVAVFHFTAMMTNHNNNSNNNNKDGTNDNNVNEETATDAIEGVIPSHKEDTTLTNKIETATSPNKERKANKFEFPAQLKILLELPNVVICAIRANELIDQLYQYEKIDCLTRVDLVDLANKALSYAGDDSGLLQPESSTTNLWKWRDNSLSIPKVLDQLCYYFLTVTNREKTIPFQRPDDENDIIHTTVPQNILMSDMIIKYYAAHAYHLRLLTDVMIEMINEGEEQFFHYETETITYMMDPNIMFHPTIDQLPDVLSINRKVAILMTDEEYESFIVDGNNDMNEKPLQSTSTHQRRDESDEVLMRKPYSRNIVAIGMIQFLGEPFSILQRFYNTSYLVGTYMYEDEAIIKLQKVKHRHFPVGPLGCREDKPYWKYPFRSHNAIENDKQYDWPDNPTLGWVYQNALRPHIIVDQSRLVYLNKEEIVDRDDKPWLGRKKVADLLPQLPEDISKYL